MNSMMEEILATLQAQNRKIEDLARDLSKTRKDLVLLVDSLLDNCDDPGLEEDLQVVAFEIGS